MSVPRVYVPGVAGLPQPLPVPPDEAHHLIHVLRLGPGADVTVFDGDGHEWRGRIASVGRQQATIDLGDAIDAVAEPARHVTLALALLKNDQMDTVIRDATALGVATIMPLISAHVAVPSRGLNNQAALTRWRRVAVAAAKQSRRAVVPAIASPAHFNEEMTRQDTGEKFICVEPGHNAGSINPQPALSSDDRRAIVFVGPEGGWSGAEVALALTCGATPLAFGPRTLRAELAPAVALSALWTRWGW